jgi:hypothetical protein
MHMLPLGPGAMRALGWKEWLAMSISGSMAAGCTGRSGGHIWSRFKVEGLKPEFNVRYMVNH